MIKDGKIWLANDDKGENIFILPKMANRHGLVAGATGTGKTVTLKVMAESFSDMGVPVFMADVKGDVAGIMAPDGFPLFLNCFAIAIRNLLLLIPNE